MHTRLLLFVSILFFMASCRDSRIHEKNEWGSYFEKHGIKKSCFILRDHSHESVYYYNKERCLERMSPASTFKMFNSMVGLESGIAPDDQYTIRWDSVTRQMPEWNKDLTMREAFKVSSVPYYQELARRVGKDYMQHYLDTANYGNKRIGPAVDQFWLNDTLQISADEQVGFVRRMYFSELPFAERTQRIVKSMMLQEETPGYKLYYKTGWSQLPTKQTLWVVGIAERIDHYKEHERSMNKSDMRLYPYFFAMNFEVAANDNTKDWANLRIEILKEILKDANAIK